MATQKKKPVRKASRTKKPAPIVGWTPAGTLRKVMDFVTTSKSSPIDSLHKRIKSLYPEANEIQAFGVSPKTNEHLRKALTKYAKKKYKMINGKQLESVIAMGMLQYSPCDVKGAVDFVLYIREV